MRLAHGPGVRFVRESVPRAAHRCDTSPNMWRTCAIRVLCYCRTECRVVRASSTCPQRRPPISIELRDAGPSSWRDQRMEERRTATATWRSTASDPSRTRSDIADDALVVDSTRTRITVAESPTNSADCSSPAASASDAESAPHHDRVRRPGRACADSAARIASGPTTAPIRVPT